MRNTTERVEMAEEVQKARMQYISAFKKMAFATSQNPNSLSIDACQSEVVQLDRGLESVRKTLAACNVLRSAV